MRPALVTPILTVMLVLEVGPEARNTSSRLMTTFTGLPAFRDSASATGSTNTVVLPPKPPPISEAVTRSLDTSMPRSAAQVSRTMKWPWVQTQSSPEPSVPTLARQACGSM